MLKNDFLVRAKTLFSLGKTFIHVVPLTEEGRGEKKHNKEWGRVREGVDSKGRGGLGHTGAKSMRRLKAGWGVTRGWRWEEAGYGRWLHCGLVAETFKTEGKGMWWTPTICRTWRCIQIWEATGRNGLCFCMVSDVRFYGDWDFLVNVALGDINTKISSHKRLEEKSILWRLEKWQRMDPQEGEEWRM